MPEFVKLNRIYVGLLSLDPVPKYLDSCSVDQLFPRVRIIGVQMIQKDVLRFVVGLRIDKLDYNV